MRTPIFIPGFASASNTGEQNPIQGNSTSDWVAVDYNGFYTMYNIFPVSGVLKELKVDLGGTRSAGEGFTFFLRKNFIDMPGPRATVLGAENYGEDIVRELEVNAGDLVGYKVEEHGTATSGRTRVSIVFETTGNSSVLLGSNSTFVAPQTDPYTDFVQGGGNVSTPNLADWSNTIMPTSGTIKTLYVHCPDPFVDPGSRPGPAIFRLVVNNADTALSCTIGVGEQSGSNLSDSVAVVAGDLISVELDTDTNNSNGNANVTYGFEFVPDTPGESICLGWGRNPSKTVVNEAGLVPTAQNPEWTATPNIKRIVTGSCNIYNFVVSVDSACGVGKSRTYTVRKNGTDTLLSVVLADSATLGADFTNVIPFTVGDYVDVTCTPSGTPDDGTDNNTRFSCVVYELPHPDASPLKPMRFYSRT